MGLRLCHRDNRSVVGNGERDKNFNTGAAFPPNPKELDFDAVNTMNSREGLFTRTDALAKNGKDL